jgi:uncharacterized protein
MTLSPSQWILGALAALLIGISKTGVPGMGILVVPVMAQLFGGRLSVGTLLPMLLFADLFAISWYRSHVRWEKLRELLPPVAVGVVAGVVLLWKLGEAGGTKDWLNPIIGGMVLAMLGVHLLRQRFGKQLEPHSRGAAVYAGTLAGFSTTVSNAGGPIMSIYLTGLELPKEQLMGTTAWYFFLVNLSKLPLYLALTVLTPDKPILTLASLKFDLIVFPVIVLGVYSGKWLLPHLRQKQFDALVLVLATIAAVQLLRS